MPSAGVSLVLVFAIVFGAAACFIGTLHFKQWHDHIRNTASLPDGGGDAGAGFGSDTEEDLVAVHPEKDKPVDGKGECTHEERFEGGPEDVERGP